MDKSATPSEKAGATTPTALLGCKSMNQKRLDEFNGTDCPTCGESFSTARGVKLHHKRTHGQSLTNYVQKCGTCGTYFEITDSVDRTYCSHACKGHTDTNEKIAVVCEWCGEEVEKYPSHASKGDSNYCSSECHNEDQRSGQKTISCAYCGDETVRRGSEVEERNKLYCCNECYQEDKSNRGTIECSHCGNVVEKVASRVDMGERNYCDSTCKQAAMAGQGNPQWRGGPDIRRAVKAQLRPNWAAVVDDERESECKLCGAENCRLDVHHIIPIMSGGTNESWNLMTLCVRCHRVAEHYCSQYPGFDPVLAE